ncbi:MAG: tetratricopeptide repeat protein [Flavobacteriales bacterium]|nr:tetratricopeptide repeat protein [Flavobacteriales bacterium]
MSKKTNKKQGKTTGSAGSFWPLILILAVTAIVFGRVSGYDFLSNWDDESYILRNTDIQEVSAENIKKIFSSFYVSNYQPVTMLVLMLEFSLFKLDPGSYHVVNLLLHLLNVFLVFRLFRRWTNRETVVWIVTAFFALHPTRIESVAWISELKDVLFTAFFLLALDFYTRYIKEGGMKHYWLALGMFLLSCLSKSMAISLPITLFLVDYWQKRKWDRKAILEKIPFLALSVLFGILALYTQSDKAMDVALKVGLFKRVLLVFYGVFMYVWKLVLPTGLAGIHYYPTRPDGTLPLLVYVSPLMLIGMGVGLWRWKSMRPVTVFGFGFFLVTIAMVVQLVPFGYAIIAERYTYVPYLGLFFFIAWVTDQIIQGKMLPQLKQSALYIILGILAFHTLLTYQRLPVWENGLTFYGDLVEKYPNAAHAHWMLGNVQKDYNQTPQALESYNRTIELDSTYAMAWFNRGVMQSNMKRYDQAVSDYNRTISLQPDYYPAYHNRGNALRELKQLDAAVKSYDEALKIQPDFENGLMARGEVLIQLQRFEEAIESYDLVLEKGKNPQALYNRGLCFYNSNQKDKACADWREAALVNFEPAVQAVASFCP